MRHGTETGAFVVGDPLVDELIRSRQERGSYAIVKASLALNVLAIPFCAYVALAVNRRLGLTLGAVVLFFDLYQLGMYRLFRSGAYRPTIDWFTATLEVSMVTVVISVDAEIQGPAYAFTSAPAFLYPVAIMVQAVRLRRSLALHAGFLAGGSYALLWLHYRERVPSTLAARLPSLETWNVIQRALYLVFTGFVAYLVCVLMRRSVLELTGSLRRRLELERTLGRHLSREVAELLLDSKADWLGEEREVTVMFADIRRFTGYAETRAPKTVLAFLNDYAELTVRAVEQHGGIVNKFTGDGVMAIFGAPVAHDDHARRAARAALAILDGVPELRPAWGTERLRIGIGIHTGRAVVGTVGTESRVEYTAIGDAVNVAARIEELNKRFDTDLLVSEATVSRLGDDAVVERVGEAEIRGRTGSVVAYRLVAIPPPGRP